MSRLRSRSSSSRHKQSVSQGGNDKGQKLLKQPISIWPEWSDQEIASEKWDISHKGKDKEKGKSPNLHAFEDPEGRVDLPLAIQANVECWKRPVDFVEDKTPVIVDPDSLKEKDVDLISTSESVTNSEIMRCIIADITNLVKLKPNMDSIEARYVKDIKDKGDVVQNDDGIWKPWQHIWPKEKSKTGVYPMYNTGGKYVVKVYWMGCWRKVTIDDWMPFNSEGQLLLPSCSKSHELWPMLLAKALLKVASLDYRGGETSCEFGDFSVVQCLTGWIPEVIPLRREHSIQLWDTLGKILPHWKLENSITVEEAKEVAQVTKKKDEKEKKSRDKLERGIISQNTTSDRSSERESRLREKDSKERFLSNAGSNSMIKEAIKEPEFAVFASYCNPPKTPLRVSVLREMADASEKLRQSGLSQNHPHSVLVTLRRDCPLVAPPPPVEIPRWRLIRQKKRKQPHDHIFTPIEPPKEPQFLEITSPFVGYCVSPTPVGRVKTPTFVKYRPDKDNMAEISEEGDKPEATKEGETEQVEGEKTDEVVVVEAPSGKEETANDLSKRGSIARSDKSDEKKDAAKLAKDTAKTVKGEKSTSTTQEKDSNTKLNRTKKMSKDLSGEKKNDPTSQNKTSGGRRMSKVDVRVASEKELKKLAKAAEKEAKNEVKVEVTDTADDTVENVAGEDGVQTTEENQENADDTCNVNKEKTFWIEYDDFWKCFGTLHIYHKPVTYMYSKSHLELKNVASTSHSKKSGTGLHTSSMAAQNSSKSQTVPAIPVGHHGLGGIPIDPPPPFLFVDSVSVMEIVVCFTSFSKWLDPPQPIFREKGRDSGSNSELKVESATELNPVPPTPGLLVAEPYTWKSLVTGQPCLRIKSTGSKAAVLVLPPGRHLLRFLLQSPNGYYVGLCSQTPFTFGDEDQVMACLQKESCRFIEHTTSVVQNIGNVVTSFSELSTNDKHTVLDLGVREHSPDMQARHYQVFMICLLETLSAQLGEEYTRDSHFAWKAFDFISRVYLKERFTFRPASTADVARIGSVHKKRSDLSRCLSSSSHRVAMIDDNVAATRIQAAFRGYYVRKLSTAYKPDSTIHQQVQENLAKSWAIIENNLEQFSIELYRRMFKLDPTLFSMFPFNKDEWTRVTYNDYNGSFMEQPVNTWFLLFREVFFVDEEILSLPKIYSGIPTCFLRVVNNDTFEEIPKVFQRVAPYTFTKNKHGYTFLAEARTCLSALSSGKFRLRLIGSTEPLPAPEGDSVNTQFVTKEIKDYYMPNKDRVILRYSVQVSEDQLITVQLGTSKTDVLIKLQILDNEEEVASACGRGHTVLPVYIVRRDRHAGEEEIRHRKRGSRPPSKDSGKDGEPARAGTAGKNPKSKSKKAGGKESSPGHSRPGSSLDKRNEARGMMNHSITQEEDLKPQVHKYIIQALVLRDSWPLTRDAWDFVIAQRNAEKPDPPDHASDSASRGDKSAGQSKSKKSKDGKESRSSKNQSASRPASQLQQFDGTKPHWTLRVVTDAHFADDIEVTKDTERQDEIRAMKAAWEAAQPGRAAKAYKSRQKFLNEHLIKVQDPEMEEGDQGEEPGVVVADITSSSTSAVAAEQEEHFTEPPPRQPSRVLKPFDITPYMRCGGERIVLDEAEENKRRQQKQEIFRQHKQWRDEVEKGRDMDRQQRNIAKEKQIQKAEEWQAALDKVREDINTAREAYRQTFIVQEQPTEEAEATEAVKERSPTPAKGRKTSKSPKGARKSPKAKKK